MIEGMIEVVHSFRLRRTGDDDERAGQVERTELWRALSELLPWQPERDLSPLSTLRSLVGGDSVSRERLDALGLYLDESLVYYRHAHASATHPLIVDATARAIKDFELAQRLLTTAIQ